MLVDVLTDEAKYAAVSSKDPRFDGWFFTCVRTTGIYCRPSCPAITPKRSNVVFAPTAAAAQEMGFRACKRCRPDASPGSPEWNVRADLVGRAMRLIADGVVDRQGVSGLADRVGYSVRQMQRLLLAEVGAGPIALARAQRSQTARMLLETTPLPVGDVAFAAGFSSIRQFNDTMRDVFAMTPTQLRASRRQDAPASPDAGAGTVSLRLPFRRPFDATSLFKFLAARAAPAVEVGNAYGYRRTVALPHGAGIVEVGDVSAASDPAAAWNEQGWIPCTLRLCDLRDLAAAVARSRRLLDLDADAPAIDQFLGSDDALAASVRLSPGRRAPGHVDGFELAVRAVLGQQVSGAGARTLAARLALTYGEPLPIADPTLTRLFPTAAAIANADPGAIPMPRARAAALVGLARAVGDGELTLDPGSDRVESIARMVALPGIGPWTASYVAMRALGDPDTFMPTDLGVRQGLRALGLPSDARGADDVARRWRPWRSYALQHVWAAASSAAGRPDEKIA
jgi:AraC family transcriptional regulator, regulatory protein of adaptative response / DNA-3-methyladenine glycosylase II